MIGAGGGYVWILDVGGGWGLEWGDDGLISLAVWMRDSGCSDGWKWVVSQKEC